MTYALLLIDIQYGFDHPMWGARNNLDAENNAAKLLQAFRSQNKHIIHVRHISTESGSPLVGSGVRFKDIVHPLPDETVFEKSVNSAFIGTNLETHLKQNAITHLTICGLTTPHCVSTTTRMAANLGFTVTLAHDACASFERNADTSWGDLPAMTAQQIHTSAINHLHGEFATARSVQSILEQQD